MKDEKCPFLEVTTVTFCKAFPVKKMIPLDKSSSARGVCTTDSFRQCPAFREINAHNSEAEHVRGFHLKPGYYFHPKHVWISPSEANPLITFTLVSSPATFSALGLFSSRRTTSEIFSDRLLARLVPVLVAP